MSATRGEAIRAAKLVSKQFGWDEAKRTRGKSSPNSRGGSFRTPAAPQFRPIGSGMGALPSNAPTPADWRQKWRTLEVAPGRWRIAGLRNANSFSPSFSSEADAEVWADDEWQDRGKL